MKTILLIATFFAAGIGFSMAQTNPGSPNAVDVEMQLAWPDGTVYLSAENYSETAIYGQNPAYTNESSLDWQLTSGGTGAEKQEWPTTAQVASEDFWEATQWPNDQTNGYLVLISPTGDTTNSNNFSSPSIASQYFYGTANFVDSDTYYTFNYNGQPQVTLITGGEPGVTSFELYQMTCGGVATHYTDQFPIGGGYPTVIPPDQIQIGSLGNVTYAGTFNSTDIPYGTLWAVLPTRTQVPITPNVSGSQLTQMPVSAQPYQLVSQCVATTPANRSRTTLGVGEQVNLFFNPGLPTNAIWTASAGGLSTTNAPSTLFTAPSNATTATITVSVAGKTLPPISYTIVEPTGINHSTIFGLIDYPLGEDGVGMTNITWIGPTNVSFDRVYIMEVPENATNISGYYTNSTSQELAHTTAGHWVQLGQDNAFGDTADQYGFPPPWSSGSFTWNIPARWSVNPNQITNSMPGWNQIFTIDGNGTATVQKFGHSATRTTNDNYTTSYQ
jgi:hypothetical protein